MRYFLMKEDKQYKNTPEVINWYQKPEARLLAQGEYSSVPKRVLFTVQGKEQIYYPEIVFHPFFLVGKEIKRLLELYEPNYRYKEVIYLHQKTKHVEEYFHPILPKLDCLSKESEYNMNHSVVTRIVLDSRKIGDKAIFTLNGVKDRHIIVRMDLVESMLRKRAKGFWVEEVEWRQSDE